jgi:hypothetical protein
MPRHDSILDWARIAEVITRHMAAADPPLGVSPMQLQRGDRFTDESGQWEVVGHPFTTAAGMSAHVRVRSVNPPGLTDLRTWAAHARITVRRTGAEASG